VGNQLTAAGAPENREGQRSPAIWRDYLHITKPGIIRSNLIAAFGGFWLASKWDIDWLLFLYTMLGTALVMASACVFNNYLDREMDTKMERTLKRPTATGRLQPKNVLVFGSLLGVIGLSVLGFQVNLLSALLGVVGIFVYVVIYTLWLKRTSTWSTSIGGISGSMPPVIGYCAVTGQVDMGAWLLFAILFLWQPPHFWALGIRRKEEYRAAGFPLLPVVKGVKRTKIQMIPYVVLLIPTTALLYVYEYVGWIYLVVSVSLGIMWLAICIQGFRAKDDEPWAKKAFMFSIYYLMITFAVMIIDTARI
jgi:protoheme IX farnesyltransferase